MNTSDPSNRPLELDLHRESHLRIRWADGAETVVPLPELRKACPCAGCRAAREERQRNPLAVIGPVADERDLVTVRDAELVGQYALRVTWQDGHSTGIYDFGLLRSLGRPAGSAAGP
jgi:DUF971 family protein